MGLFNNLRTSLASLIAGKALEQQQMSALAAAQFLPGMTQRPPKRGTREFLLAYSTFPVLRMVVDKIASSVASVEWGVYTDGPDGPQRAEGSMLERVMDGGNRIHPGIFVRKLTSLHIELVGEAHWLKAPNAHGATAAVFPLCPHWITTMPSTVNPYYSICVPNGWSGSVHESQMVSFIDIDPERPYERGSGRAMALEDELNADEAAAQHVSSFLLNHARPDLIISGAGKEASLDADGVRKIEAVWTDRFGGPRNRGKPMFSSVPLSVEQIGTNLREQQFMELREYERDIIYQTYGVPPEIFGITSNSNRATIEGADLLFTKEVLRPRLRFMREVINCRLAPEYAEPGIYVDFEDPVPEDREHKASQLTARPWMASIDEHRESVGLSALPDEAGKVRLVPFNFVEVTPEGEEAVAPILEQRAKALRKAPDEGDIDQIINAAKADELADELDPVVRAIVSEFGQVAIEEVGLDIDFSLFDPTVSRYLDNYGADRVSGLFNETIRNDLRATLIDGVEQGETSASLIRRVTDVYDGADEVRARRIVATETNTASNFATTEGHKQAGITEREWLATRDDRVRDTHMAMDGQRVGIDEPFRSPSGATGMHPSAFDVASESVNCRCGTIPVIDFGDETRALVSMDAKAREGYYKARERRKRPFEEMMYSALQRGFRRQRDEVIRRLRELA